MTWDPETLELVINTDDEGNIGEYFVTLRNMITTPDDYSLEFFTDNLAETTVEIVVKATSNLPAGCSETAFDSFDPGQILEASVFGAPQTVQIQLPADSVSKIEGNQDGFTYCGER